MQTDDKPESRYVDAPTGRVAYQSVGEGPAIVMIHGGGPGAYGWSNYRLNVGPLAARGFQVITMDLPGYGESASRDTSDGMYVPNARAVIDILDAEGIAQADLVGNSLGGATSLRAALDYPDRIRRMVLMGPGGLLPSTSTAPSEGLGRMLNFYEGEGPTIEKLDRVLDLLVYDRSTITPELVAERFKTCTAPQTLANPPLRQRGRSPRDVLWKEGIENLQHKTLIIWGQEDRILPLDMAFIALKLIPNADLHVFSKCGHWAQWERADEFNELVGNFFANH